MGRLTPQLLVTFLHIHKQAGRSIQQQLYQQLKDAVRQGLLQPLDRLPSSRALSAELHIGRNTLLLVYEQLSQEGYLDAKVGAGTFVSPAVAAFSGSKPLPGPLITPTDRFMSRPHGLGDAFAGHVNAREPIQAFQHSVPRVSAFPIHTWARLSARVYRQFPELHLGYEDAQGYGPLRQALAGHLRISRSMPCEADQILIVNSTRQALHLTAELLLGAGDEVWMEDPGYPGAQSAIQRFGGVLCPVPIGPQGLDLTYAIQHYPRAKLAYVTPSHQFPMGSILSLSQRLKLVNWAQQHQRWIIEDDYDSEFHYTARPLPALQSLDPGGRIIYVGSFSKVLLPALRLAYLVLPTKDMARQFAQA